MVHGVPRWVGEMASTIHLFGCFYITAAHALIQGTTHLISLMNPAFHIFSGTELPERNHILLYKRVVLVLNGFKIFHVLGIIYLILAKGAEIAVQVAFCFVLKMLVYM